MILINAEKESINLRNYLRLFRESSINLELNLTQRIKKLIS